jgi:hypothetical protein
MNRTSLSIAGAGLLLALLGAPAASAAEAAADPAERVFQAKLMRAMSNDPQGQYEVGQLYEQGTGTPRNLNLARMWYTKASNQGHAQAREKLASWDRDRRDEVRREREQIEQAERAKRQTEAEAAAAAKATRERATAERAEKAAKAARPVEPVAKPAAAPAAAAPAAAVESKAPAPKEAVAKEPAKAEDAAFSTNPCKGPQARFTSTCQ